jgi:DNA-binding XRE family transcriptional regulator
MPPPGSPSRTTREHRHATSDAAALDKLLRPLRGKLPQQPRTGWAKPIRIAQGISTRRMAARLGVSQPAVIQAERSEAAGTISIAQLYRLAEALDCDLRYVLIPRN